VIKVGDKPIRLGGLRQIDFGPQATVHLVDGKTTLTGPITGLTGVEIDLGGQSATVDLTRAATVQFTGTVQAGELTLAVVARRDGKEIGRQEVKVAIRDDGALPPASLASVPITPPKLEEDKVIRKLPEGFSDVVVGGGGRYFIFHLPRLRKLAIFDINVARVTGYIPVEDPKARFAAGLTKVVVGNPGSATLERWSLETLKREATAYPVLKGEIGSVCMGAGSNGPVLVNGVLMDLQTLKPLPGPETPGPAGLRVLPASDGSAFGTWNTNYSPGTATVFLLEGNKLRRLDEGEMGHVAPGPDGKMLYTAKGPVSRTFKRAMPGDEKLGYCLPGVRGPYFVSLTPTGANVHLLGYQRPIARLEKMEHGLRFNGWDREEFGVWKRFFLVPEANVIVVLPESNDRVMLYKLDMEKALETSGIDYLLITSQPPAVAKRSSAFQYQLAVKTRKGGVKYKVESGPKGMEVTPTGLLKWTVPAEGTEKDVEVILTVRDSEGQEVFHTFTLQLQR
jgi:hypothetical protein